MNFGLLVLAPILLAGHASLWVPIWNRVESTAMPRWIKSRISKFAKIACIIMPPIILACYILRSQFPFVMPFVEGYSALCALVAFLVLPSGLVRRFSRTYETQLRGFQSEIEVVHPAKEQSRSRLKKRNQILFSIPWNQSFEFEHNLKEIELTKLPPQLDGLSIAHLTDLHFTGAVAKCFYDRAIEKINASNPDIIAVTGDLVDDGRCINWLPSTLGRLRAKHGVYVILGNHDCKHNLSELRSMLTDLGLFVLGGRSKRLTINGKRILLAGNELPWIVPATDMSKYPRKEDDDELRILLSHSPDQIHWARFNNFDLMLAGHTHGGQFRLPWFGAVVCPSSRPLSFASGTFYEHPTLLHVSRGLSGEVPLRLNCRPEVTQLVVRSPQLVYQEYLHRQEITELARLKQEIDGAVRVNQMKEADVPTEYNDGLVTPTSVCLEVGAMSKEPYDE